MAGLYIHIPFCRKACHYCDFHFSTNLEHKQELLKALEKELRIKKNYLAATPLNTIYFGGGSPSILELEELRRMLEVIRENFAIAPDAEITLEANPDDITNTVIPAHWKEMGINRLSIGIQSFVDKHLQWMNRAHNAAQASNAVKFAREAGISNMTIDFIYGIPGMTAEEWRSNLLRAAEMGVQHISAYCLTVEERTVLHKQVREGLTREAEDEEIEEQVNIMVELLAAKGFERYEISNFALPGYHSRHNSAYWAGDWYLGVGPSAHSYNEKSRSWNVSSNAAYIKALNSDQEFSEIEWIDEATAYNEYIMTRLRTSKGIVLEEVKKKFLVDLTADFPDEISDMLEEEEAVLEEGCLRLTHKGRFFADGLAASLFLEKEEN